MGEFVGGGRDKNKKFYKQKVKVCVEKSQTRAKKKNQKKKNQMNTESWT